MPQSPDEPEQLSNNVEEGKVILRIPPNVRLVAFGLDFIICYLVATLTTLIPFVNRALSLHMMMILAFLSRDFFFQGRGFGKNLMGLRVVDSTTGGSITLLQSALRNIILVAPLAAFQIITAILALVPVPWLDAIIMQILNIICTVYVVIVLPMETYRVITRPDSIRKGDELAHTMVVEAPMDFSNFLPPVKS